MRVVIIGGSGFIGRALTRSLVGDGHLVVVVSRTGAGRAPAGGVSFAPFDGKSGQGWAEHCDGAAAVVNLAGENIASGFWSATRKQRILESRVDAGRAVMDALERVSHRPAVLVQGSAIGYYGDRGDAPTDEDTPRGTGFLAEVAQAWEASTAAAQALGVRRVVARTSVVLGAAGGALPRMLAPYRFFCGGPLGSGRQWFSWIHLNDEIRAIRFLMEQEQASGPYNLAAPQAVTQADLAAALGKALSRPAWLRTPPAVLRLVLGEMGQELLLNGARVAPRRLTELGFTFRFPTLAAALAEILGGPDVSHA
ncbi:TIGR01777 family protein [Desulfovibrio aerotolerans]|uniref:TIGR01777 family protein n=1 Tax=Solidesulfovibrio aerotolerans TaxID=295255 RepID=A0A7C9ILH0_9BACT|nr:TIGR01777 family oxidoreductase [Solidesulfovibrio aerotolerans]MYL83881.1 TIGR01777 family protein [Solidesulfovibrio aerotolerans]